MNNLYDHYWPCSKKEYNNKTKKKNKVNDIKVIDLSVETKCQTKWVFVWNVLICFQRMQ